MDVATHVGVVQIVAPVFHAPDAVVGVDEEARLVAHSGREHSAGRIRDAPARQALRDREAAHLRATVEVELGGVDVAGRRDVGDQGAPAEISQGWPTTP